MGSNKGTYRSYSLLPPGCGICPNNMIIAIVFIFSTTVNSNKIVNHKSDISRCADLGELYSVEDDQCYTPLSRGHCRQGEMIVLSESGVGICKRDTCKENEVLMNGSCVGMFEMDTCQGRGEMLRWDVKGQGKCGCMPDGWGHMRGRTGCYQQSSRCPCSRGQIVRENEQPCTRVGIYESVRWLRENDRDAFENGILRLKELNCGVEGRKLCCDLLEEGEIELTTRDVEQAYINLQSSTYQCGPNSTPSGNKCEDSSRPWPSVSSATCYPVTEEFREGDDCYLYLTDDRKISCYDNEATDIRSVVRSASSRCRRGFFFSRLRHRCVRRFG